MTRLFQASEQSHNALSLGLTTTHFAWFFNRATVLPAPALPSDITTPILDFKSSQFNTYLCPRPVLTPNYIIFLIALSNYLVKSYTHKPNQTYPASHPITIFHNYTEFCLLPMVQENPLQMANLALQLLPFTFEFGSLNLKNTHLSILPRSYVIDFLLENSTQTLYSLCHYLDSPNPGNIDFGGFLADINEKILQDPKPELICFLNDLITYLESNQNKQGSGRLVSQQMIASYSATLLLVTLYTGTPIKLHAFNNYVAKINPPAFFSQSLAQILYLLAIATPPAPLNNHASQPHFYHFAKSLSKHSTDDYCSAAQYGYLATQFAISHGRIDILDFLYDHDMALPSKKDLQIIMGNNKSLPYSYQFLKKMDLSPQELATNILQCPNNGSLSVFSYLDHLHKTLQLFPHAHSDPHMSTTYSILLRFLEPTFSEYRRLDSRGDYSDSFVKVVNSILSKGIDYDHLPDFFADTAALYLKKNQTLLTSASSTEQRLLDVLHHRLTKTCEQCSPWLLFSPFSAGKIYRKALEQGFTLLHKLTPNLLRKHAFVIRHLLLWRNLSLASYLWSCLSSHYAATKLVDLAHQQAIDSSCLHLLASCSQQSHLTYLHPINHKPAQASSLSYLPTPSDHYPVAKETLLPATPPSLMVIQKS